MPISERKQASGRNRLRRNTQLVGCNLYEEDAKTLKAEALRRATSVKALLRDCMVETLGRPPQKRA